MSAHAAVFCLVAFCVFPLSSLSVVTECLTRSRVKKLLRLVLYFRKRTTHLHLPLFSLLYPDVAPPLPMAVQSDPPLAQSWLITPHPNQGEG